MSGNPSTHDDDAEGDGAAAAGGWHPIDIVEACEHRYGPRLTIDGQVLLMVPTPLRLPSPKPDWFNATTDGQTQREKHRQAVLDLKNIELGWRPDATDPELLDAPVVEGWAIGTRFMGGDWLFLRADLMTGHPTLKSGPLSRSSFVIAVDMQHLWLRTLSRFYRLGARR